MKSPSHQIERLHRDAQAAMHAGNLRAAHQHCLAILKIDQQHADAWFLCGVIAADNGLREKATEIVHKAIALAPERAEYHAELGKMLLASGELSKALVAADEAFALQPQQAAVLNTLGTLLSHCGEHDRALDCFERTAEKISQSEAPNVGAWRADFHFNWAAALRIAGHFDEAEQQLEQTIALSPQNYRAHFALSSLRRQSADDNHLQRLKKHKADIRNPRDQLNLGHALAKEEEDLGNYTQSLQYLQWAKSAHRSDIRYDAEADRRIFERIRTLFDARWAAGPDGDSTTSEPIFILGMPRTGTTLVEQILSSHSAVFAAGELQNFPMELRRWVGRSPTDMLDDAVLEAAASKAPNALGQQYLDSTRPRTGHSKHFIDKLPLNFLTAGLIQKALPKSKIICLRRDAMDTCLSNYRQLFALNFPYYRYNLDLLDCGRYYMEFDRLMAHWDEILPGRVYNIQYEAVIEDPEKEARALLDFCSLPWENECLAFHERKTSVATPSAVQVRQGIYSSSIDRWRRYGDAMQPLYELLQSAGFYD